MRNFGAVLLLLGVLGFFYASSKLDEVPPLTDRLTVTESLREPAGRWQMARFGAAVAGGFGLLMAMFPKGR
jgi:hypothetical protein